MKVKQLNLRKSLVATNLFASRLELSTIGFLTEPYHYRNRICKLGQNFDLFPDTTLQAPPRAALLIPKYLNATFLPHLSHPDVSVAYLKHANLLLVSGYCDGKLPVIQDWLTKIIEYADTKNCKLVLGFDSNAHSELFGHETDDRGEALESFIFTNNLDIENRGDIPTFSTIRLGRPVTSFIDITLSRDVDVVDWCVDESFNNSDHNTISFEILVNSPPPAPVRPWKSANWTRFRRIIAAQNFHIPDHMSIKKIDHLVSKLYQVLNKALNKSCPLRTPQLQEGAARWWNNELSKEALKLNKQFKKAKRVRSLTESIKLKVMKQKYKRLCQRSKKNAWRKFTFHLKNTGRMAALAKTLQKRERHKLYTLRKSDGTMTEPGQETLNLLFQTHFPASTPLKSVSYQANTLSRFLSSSAYIHQKYIDWINIDRLNKAFKKFNKKKSPGPDGIKPIVFEHLPVNFKNYLLFIYKCCLHFHYTPVLWKDTKVIFIPKPGKDDYTLPKSFRPISLSNYFLKTLERLVCWKMDESLALYPLHTRQHGFMPGRSTESAISITTDYIEKYLAYNQHCLAVFLDISAAFDSIDIDHVRRSLLKHGGLPDLAHWYHDYLSHRNLYAELHQETASCSTGVGFPQGGVCSARFWLIAFNQAIKIINSAFVEGVGYADDCCVLIGGTDQSHMVAQVQRAINKLIAWGHTCGLRFNHSKTVAILFTRSTKVFRRHIRIDGNDIPYSHQVKYLGVTLDSKLLWNIHIKQKVTACKRFLFMVASIAKDAFGPSPRIMRWTFLCVVRPMITYGALCWAHMINHGNTDKLLRNLNRAGMNLYANFPRSSPTRTVEIITDTIPLSLQAMKVGLSSRIRLRNVISSEWEAPNTPRAKKISHIKYWDQLIMDNNLEEFMAQDDFINIRMPFNQFQIITDSFSGDRKFLSLSQVNVYTDGSKFNDKVGAGVFITINGGESLSRSFRLPNKASVFQAEIFAINQAALLLRDFPPHLQYIKFFVDSQAALLALNNASVSSRLVGDTVHNLNNLMHPVRLVWIKAHVGHHGNERADELAKLGTSLDVITHVDLPKQATKQAIKFAIDENWKLQWSLYNDGRQSKQFFQLPDRNKAKYCYNLNRQELGRFIRIVTGHNNLFYHRSNVDKTHNTSPLCRFCKEENETFFHFATNCPCFRLSRFHHFQNDTCFKNGKWSIRQLLDFSNIPSITAALGGTFDPEQHLLQQCINEDHIEASQVNANAQPGRAHDPLYPIHTMSDSDDDTQQIHSSLSRSSDTGGPDAASTLFTPGLPGDPCIQLPNVGSDLGGADAVAMAPSTLPADHFQRTSLNFDTLDVTDDEYLINESDSD